MICVRKHLQANIENYDSKLCATEEHPQKSSRRFHHRGGGLSSVPEAVSHGDDLHLAVRGRDVGLLAGWDGRGRGGRGLDDHHIFVQNTWEEPHVT